MRIGMVLAKPFPPDIRVKKEALALIAAGYHVGLLAQAPDETALSRETMVYGLEVLRALVPRESIWVRNIKGLTLLERNWLEPLQWFIDQFQPDVLHVHDFPMVDTVLKVSQPCGLPVVADLHENMPAAFRIWRKALDPVKRTKDAVFHNYHLWRWHERRVLPRCAYVIVVVPEAAERLGRYGIAQEKIVVVSNTEDETNFSLQEPDPSIQKRYRTRWVVSYVGGVGPHRGIETAIRATTMAAERIPNLLLLVVGAQGERQIQHLNQLVDRAGATAQVDILEWQPFESVSSYIQVSAACLVPHADTEHTQTTVPHKLFQYMLAGKPVVVSDVRPLRRIVEETEAGLVFQADNPTSLAQALVQLYADPERSEQLGCRGRAAATGPYAWRHDASRLVRLYQDLEQRT